MIAPKSTKTGSAPTSSKSQTNSEPSADELFARGFRKLARITPIAPDPDPSMPSDGGEDFDSPR